MRKMLSAAIAALALTAASPALAATTLVSSGGVLTGINNLAVAGTQYNVTFTRGTCIGLFGGCNATADFTFNTATSATLAADAILAAIAGTAFDANPSLINGCLSASQCGILVPYAVDGSGLISAIGAYNNSSLSPNPDISLATGAGYSSAEASNGGNAYAIFSLATVTSAVPEPATWAMMLLGFGGIGLQMRRKRPHISRPPQIA